MTNIYKYIIFLIIFSLDTTITIILARLWTYQCCTELGFFPSSTSPNGTRSGPFGSLFPIEFYVHLCNDIFGRPYRPFTMASMIESIGRTREIYGSNLETRLSRVVFFNSLVDPWYKVSVVRDLNPSVKAVVIPETSHAMDMMPNRPSDPESLREARQKIKLAIGEFLEQTG